MFYPESGGAPAAAVADDQGRYQLATGAKVGLAPGNYTVIVAATESEPAEGQGQTSPKKRLITPTEYTDPKKTEFHADVQAGQQHF